MKFTLQIILCTMSIVTFIFVITKIRKSQLDIQDSVIWILLSLLLIIMSLCLSIIDKIAALLGFISTANFVFTMIMFFLLIIVFGQTVKISLLNEKLKNLNHYISLKEHDEENKNNDK